MRFGLIVILTCHELTIAQDSVKLGEIVHNLIFPSEQLMGGLGKVMDDFHNLDNNLKGCGKRQLCEAMSLGSQIARSDGTYGFQKGFFRHGVDAALDALFEVAKPFMEVFGMGSVARHEVSFTRFLVDMLDSAIISVTRFLGGRRLSRQLELISPVSSLVKPVTNALGLIPRSYYGNVLDLAVDVMGIADRSRGSYGIVRSAGMGYFFGDGDDSACRSLHSGLHGDPYCADDDGGFFPLSMIRPINRNELGGTVRLGGASGLNPLLDRTRNPYAINHVPQLELKDLMSPTKMLCKMDQLMDAYSGQIDVHEDPDLAPIYIHEQDLALQTYGELEETVSIRKNDNDISLERLSYDERLFVERMALYEKFKAQQARTPGMREIRRKMTNKDKFNEYCQEEDAKEIREILEKNHNITVTASESNTITEEDLASDSGNYEDYDDVVEVKAEFLNDDMEEDDVTELEILARIGDRSLLAERMTDVVDGEEKEAVETLVTTFNILANGQIEKVVQIDAKKGAPVLLVQFDTSEYRDEVLKGSRRPEARSQSSVRFRRPKVKDLKHVVNLIRRH